ncbi:hypothetical protein M9H77_06571 [Catharanthus roseus]|uniref:Uncharacterized protein n=1 Tax=Catharanthus roseus TaxID=4058 RepID=A0ACC0BSJ1_CATRO|nr:hypothetical protein M9H77_06571 [Catharanthus roseus]
MASISQIQSVEIGACSETKRLEEEEDDDFLNDLQELEDEDLDDDEKSGSNVDMSKELGKNKREACLTTIVKGDILIKGTNLDLKSMTLRNVVEETTKIDCLESIGGQNHESGHIKGLVVDYGIVLPSVTSGIISQEFPTIQESRQHIANLEQEVLEHDNNCELVKICQTNKHLVPVTSKNMQKLEGEPPKVELQRMQYLLKDKIKVFVTWK